MLNLSSSSVQKFPLFQQLGLPVLARESMNNHAKIYQNLRRDKYLMLNALRSSWGERILERLRNMSQLWFYPEEKDAFPLNELTCFGAIFIAIIVTRINSTDWKTWLWRIRFRGEWPVEVVFCVGLEVPWNQFLFPGKDVRSSWRLFSSYFPVKLF